MQGHHGEPVPSYAFDESWILQGERAVLALVASLFVAAIFWFTVVKGRCRRGFSSTGPLSDPGQDRGQRFGGFLEGLKTQLELTSANTSKSSKTLLTSFRTYELG